MNDNDRLDLSALDPERDPDRLERVVDNVLGRLGPALVPESAPLPHEIALVMARRFTPLVAAASLVAMISSAVLLTRPATQAAIEPTAELSWLDAWLADGTTPDARDVLFFFAGDPR